MTAVCIIGISVIVVQEPGLGYSYISNRDISAFAILWDQKQKQKKYWYLICNQMWNDTC